MVMSPISGRAEKHILCRDKLVFVKLYKQLVRLHLEYATTVWSPHIQPDIGLVETIQKRATKCIQGLQNIPYKTRLELLNLESLYHQHLVNDLSYLYHLFHVTSNSFISWFTLNADANRGHEYK